MGIRRLEDIELEKRIAKRDEITNDINNVINGVLGKGNEDKKGGVFSFVLKLLFWLLLLVLFVNLVLGNVWLLKFFLKDFFGLF